eukprot:TRINITY_DN66795_c6_g1_i1.p1 TRINITY_DN66795_c6_g1~~TRINITY_DN66795_c6_g1_i1.p1  ORF type:complete len:1223 (+),score=785.61 TRINITY_DN66795_c6_g1_i1:322-3669(+)
MDIAQQDDCHVDNSCGDSSISSLTSERDETFKPVPTTPESDKGPVGRRVSDDENAKPMKPAAVLGEPGSKPEGKAPLNPVTGNPAKVVGESECDKPQCPDTDASKLNVVPNTVDKLANLPPNLANKKKKTEESSAEASGPPHPENFNAKNAMAGRPDKLLSSKVDTDDAVEGIPDPLADEDAPKKKGSKQQAAGEESAAAATTGEESAAAAEESAAAAAAPQESSEQAEKPDSAFAKQLAEMEADRARLRAQVLATKAAIANLDGGAVDAAKDDLGSLGSVGDTGEESTEEATEEASEESSSKKKNKNKEHSGEESSAEESSFAEESSSEESSKKEHAGGEESSASKKKGKKESSEAAGASKGKKKKEHSAGGEESGAAAAAEESSAAAKGKKKAKKEHSGEASGEASKAAVAAVEKELGALVKSKTQKKAASGSSESSKDVIKGFVKELVKELKTEEKTASGANKAAMDKLVGALEKKAGAAAEASAKAEASSAEASATAEASSAEGAAAEASSAESAAAAAEASSAEASSKKPLAKLPHGAKVAAKLLAPLFHGEEEAESEFRHALSGDEIALNKLLDRMMELEEQHMRATEQSERDRLDLELQLLSIEIGKAERKLDPQRAQVHMEEAEAVSELTQALKEARTEKKGEASTSEMTNSAEGKVDMALQNVKNAHAAVAANSEAAASEGAASAEASAEGAAEASETSEAAGGESCHRRECDAEKDQCHSQCSTLESVEEQQTTCQPKCHEEHATCQQTHCDTVSASIESSESSGFVTPDTVDSEGSVVEKGTSEHGPEAESASAAEASSEAAAEGAAAQASSEAAAEASAALPSNKKPKSLREQFKNFAKHQIEFNKDVTRQLHQLEEATMHHTHEGAGKPARFPKSKKKPQHHEASEATAEATEASAASEATEATAPAESSEGSAELARLLGEASAAAGEESTFETTTDEVRVEKELAAIKSVANKVAAQDESSTVKQMRFREQFDPNAGPQVHHAVQKLERQKQDEVQQMLSAVAAVRDEVDHLDDNSPAGAVARDRASAAVTMPRFRQIDTDRFVDNVDSRLQDILHHVGAEDELKHVRRQARLSETDAADADVDQVLHMVGADQSLGSLE